MVIIWHGDRIAAARRGAAIKSARISAETVKGESMDKAPVEESILRGSASVDNIENGAEISYNTPYARRMHNDHSYTPSHPGTGPDYLHGPLIENSGRVFKEIARAVKSVG